MGEECYQLAPIRMLDAFVHHHNAILKIVNHQVVTELTIVPFRLDTLESVLLTASS